MHMRSFRTALLALSASLMLPLAGLAQEEAPAEPLPSPDPVPALTLGNVLPTKPIRRTFQGYRDVLNGNRQVFNERWIDTRPLPSDKATQLDYDGKTADFTVGQTLTGEESKATALIVAKEDAGSSGTLTLTKVQGEFVNDEAIADGAGGSALVNGKLREGVWVLDFAYKPMRIVTVEVPGKGRKQLHYLYYQVVNRTGKPRVLVPELTVVVPETGQRFNDTVIPSAVQVIQNREDPTSPLLGAVDVMGMIPVSDQEGIDKAVFGVAVWDNIDPKADAFSVYIRGLSDYSFSVPSPDGGKPVVKHKTLRLDFRRRGDERAINELEIESMDPPYEWVYW